MGHANIKEANAVSAVLRSLADEQIDRLRVEAGEAGDDVTAAICRRALEGSPRARRAVAEVIADARAMMVRQ